jgi:phage terminase large subunit
MSDVILTSPYQPREHALDFHARKHRFSVMVWHRRCGKTVACVNDLIDKALQCTLPMPRYSYVAPFYKMAKAIAWNYLKYYAAPVTEKVMESELAVILVNGARIQLYGADNPDSLRGVYHDGIVLDEYGMMAPRLFGEVIAPALADRKGWAVFIGTPAGPNHFFELWEDAKDKENWFTMMLKASESGVIDAEELELIKNQPGIDEDTYAQEMECDFHAANKGAYYGKLINRLEEEGHLGIFPHNPKLKVMTGWDLGWSDDTSIWFAQRVAPDKIHVIDHFAVAGYSIEDIVDELRRRPYEYAPFYLPHDAKAKSLQTGKSIREQLWEQGAKSVIIPQLSVQQGIQAVRTTLPQMYFNVGNPSVREGLNSLRMYQREFDDKRGVFKQNPLHNWASHDADAMRYLSLGMNPHTEKSESKPLMGEKPPQKGNVLNLENLFEERAAAQRSTRI